MNAPPQWRPFGFTERPTIGIANPSNQEKLKPAVAAAKQRKTSGPNTMPPTQPMRMGSAISTRNGLRERPAETVSNEPTASAGPAAATSSAGAVGRHAKPEAMEDAGITLPAVPAQRC